MDAAGERCSLRPLVLLAEHPHFVAGARRDRAGRLGHMAGIERCVAGWRLHRRRRPVRALLYRHHHQPFSVDRAASLHADAGRLPAWHAGVSPRRHAVPAAGDPLLLGLVLLGVPGQGARRCELSLSSRREVGCGRRDSATLKWPIATPPFSLCSTSSICLSVNGRTEFRPKAITPIGDPSRRSGTPRTVRKPPIFWPPYVYSGSARTSRT